MAQQVPVHLVRGSDPSLTRDAVADLIDALVGDGDRSLLIEELSGDDYELSAVIGAAQTPPFLTDRRIVVARDVHRFATADDVGALVRYLADPLPSTSLVLVWETGRVPKPLLDAVKAAGGEHRNTEAPQRAKDRERWFADQVAGSSIRLDARARTMVSRQLGEDVGRLRGLLETLEGAYGPGVQLTEEEVAPFVGDAGAVAPWDLTDAIDRGDISLAVEQLHRLLGHGERHPLVVMATLHTHYGRMLRLDGAEVTSEREAAELLGMRGGSTFPAKKAFDQVRVLGHDRLVTAFRHLAQADLDLRGAKDWPDELVMEVLVARLAQLRPRAR